MLKKFLILLVFFFFLISDNLFSQEIEVVGQFRAVWISTVKRLDYPSKNGMSSDELKNEYLKILDSCKAIGLNAVIFQIRPAADAFYNSKYEPWSEWLTGKQGRAPNPYFDPLEFMIEQAHKRNMQFHAWINPFRAVATISKADIVQNHITKIKPQWFFNYGVNKYFDPGIPEVRNYIANIVTDIVKRYDVDGIHFDDYFYPYPLKNQNRKIIDIPDKKTFLASNSGFSNIKDWRRDNINQFIEQINDSIKKIKPWVKFGVSPPGVWRNKGYDPDGSATLGLAAYDWLYADVITWLKNDWIDYVTPQLYWYIGHKRANYRILLDWWARHTYGADLYIGLNIHGIDVTQKSQHWGNPNEIPEQIKLAESYPIVKGFFLYRYKSLTNNPLGIKDSLRNNYFADTSTVLLISNIVEIKDTVEAVNNFVEKEIQLPEPTIPQNISKYRLENEISIVWDQNPSEQAIVYYNIYKYESKLDSTVLFIRSYKDFFRFKRSKKIAFFAKKYSFVITAVNKQGIESGASEPISVKLN